MNTQQAYIHGFVKRAAEYGLCEDKAMDLLKSASTRAMREFREGTPAGEKIEEMIRKRFGFGGVNPFTEDNIAMLKDNPRGIVGWGEGDGKITPKLREALRNLKHPSTPRDHIKLMNRAYIRGTDLNLGELGHKGVFGLNGPVNGPRWEDAIMTDRQREIRSLAREARRSFDPKELSQIARNIERANAQNASAAARRLSRKALEQEEKGLVRKLFGFLRKK
jgi:hypothetical protein